MAVLTDTTMLQPVVALVGWTFVMEAWMYATRIPAISKYKVDINPNATTADFNKRIPRPIQWKADNYNHLMEQPTVFYAVALVLAHLGANDRLTTVLAWSYVGVRVVHSLVQALTNNIMQRFQIFIVSSFVLLGLTSRAAMMIF